MHHLTVMRLHYTIRPRLSRILLLQALRHTISSNTPMRMVMLIRGRMHRTIPDRTADAISSRNE